MKTKDILEETFISLSSNKIRSGLTMLGIIIGIASVITMTAIGVGAKNSISESIQSIGANLLIVYPGAPRGAGQEVHKQRGSAKTLTMSNVNTIKNLSGVRAISAEVSGHYQVTAKGTNTNTTVDGVNPDYMIVRNIDISQGSFITDKDNKISAKVAVLGPTVVSDLFGDNITNPVGQEIRIKNNLFRVVGVTVAKGGTGFQNPDDMIYIPVATAQRYFSGDNYVSSISISAENANVASEVQTEITNTLLELHHISDSSQADFSIMNQADIMATASSVTGTFTLLLSAIAGISLLVGGIGIMNMMLTSVTERTREIGLRKAIGAKRKDINIQFLTEAVVLTFLGGIIGVILGWGISLILSHLGIIQAQVSIPSVLLAFGVSAFIGIIFGYYPAQRASKLNSIETLRYE